MKDTFYFSHDYNAASDEKIVKLLSKHGMAGYGIFWRIVENLYNNANALSLDYDRIAYDLHIENSEIVRSVINDFGLFSVEGNQFGSASIERRLDERNEKSEKARQSAFKRWKKPNPEPGSDANALNNDANAPKNDAIKESIVKESIKKDSKEEPEQIPALPKTDFISCIIEKFVSVFPDYVITTPGKEREMAGKLLATWKKVNPELNQDEMLESLRSHFERCRDNLTGWLRENLSLAIMVTKYNEISNQLKNPKKNKVLAGDQDLSKQNHNLKPSEI